MLKLIIFGIDALDKAMVEKFKCRNLMQKDYGQTDITEFKLPKTVVLWSSFLTGKNMEDEVKEDLWSFTLPKERTFFKFFQSFKAIDVPAFTLKQDEHALERKYLAGYFKKENTVEEFDKVVWDNHEKIKREFFDVLEGGEDYDVVMVYFDIVDAIGHLSFGIDEKMREVYEEVDRIVGKIAGEHDCPILVISDHGMERIGKGRYGDHNMNGFWSSNGRIDFESKPMITDFYSLISELGG